MNSSNVLIIGAGIGGLATALRLAHAGCSVTVVEAHNGPGGKMRTIPSAAGPVDAGPTVLTMRPLFEALFADVDAHLSDHVTLEPLDILARHYWDDGQTLDLAADTDTNIAAIKAAFGTQAAQEFIRFSARAKRLFQAFDAPMMRHPSPRPLELAKGVLRKPHLLRDMAPHQSLHNLLKSSFSDKRLVQLFGRYATYVGGSPLLSPAILSLIWEVEAAGVWAVKGGMHKIAQAVETLCKSRGVTFIYDTAVQQIIKTDARVSGIATKAGIMRADTIVFNGDPRALHAGLLGQAVTPAVPKVSVTPRSLSAHVHAFAATPTGAPLAHHNVFFAQDEKAEFTALAAGNVPQDATLYVCAQDYPDQGQQRFEIIRNAPPDLAQSAEDITRCHTQTFQRLAAFDLTFSPTPAPTTLTAPQDFGRMFPGSLGSLYGRSPHGMMAAFKRPPARTKIKGLYLCGGGTHPGAGVPMATLSAQHAAEAIMTDLSLTFPSRRTATRGGISTA